jgi:hypothetical protein
MLDIALLNSTHFSTSGGRLFSRTYACWGSKCFAACVKPRHSPTPPHLLQQRRLIICCCTRRLRSPRRHAPHLSTQRTLPRCCMLSRLAVLSLQPCQLLLQRLAQLRAAASWVLSEAICASLAALPAKPPMLTQRVEPCRSPALVPPAAGVLLVLLLPLSDALLIDVRIVPASAVAAAPACTCCGCCCWVVIATSHEVSRPAVSCLHAGTSWSSSCW